MHQGNLRLTIDSYIAMLSLLWPIEGTSKLGTVDPASAVSSGHRRGHGD